MPLFTSGGLGLGIDLIILVLGLGLKNWVLFTSLFSFLNIVLRVPPTHGYEQLLCITTTCCISLDAVPQRDRRTDITAINVTGNLSYDG